MLPVKTATRQTPTTRTMIAATRPGNVFGESFMPLKRTSQTFQNASPQELNAGLSRPSA